MSHLQITILNRTYLMNVLSFQSGVYQSIASAQTKHLAVHFPIKVNQPDIDFTVIFSSEASFQGFQDAVRYHQQMALATNRLLTLNWPERSIDNWTGLIKKFQAGGARRNYAPRAQFTVQLVDSMSSSRVMSASTAAPWQTIYGGAGGPADGVLQLPTEGLTNFLNQFPGGNALAQGVASVPWWWQQ